MSSGRSRSGGTCEREDVQPVEEVLAEASLVERRAQVAVGRGEDRARRPATGPAAAQALDLARLEHAQQLGLQLERHVADLVEQQRAAVRLLDAARRAARWRP